MEDQVRLIASSASEKAASKATQKDSDWAFIKVVARLSLNVIRRFWALSSATLLGVVALYYVFGGVFAFLLVVFAVSGILYNASDRLLYHPDQPPTSRVFIPSPSSVSGLENFQSLYIQSRDRVKLHVFLIKVADDNAPTLLFLHGNAGNIGHRLLNVKAIVERLRVNVCLLEYRGYGKSSGSPYEEGLYLDAQAALDFLHTRSDINAEKIVVFGRSLGGAVAIDLASKSENRGKIAALLLENTFTSVPDVAKALFDLKIIRLLPTWCYKNRFSSRSKACRVSTPTLFLSGSADALIPSRMMTELFEACGAETKRLARFPGGTHNETWMVNGYYEVVDYFFKHVVKVKEAEVGNIVPDPPKNLVSDAVGVV